MVTTRRQSGAVSKAEASNAISSDNSDISDDEPDYQPRGARGKSAPGPRAKRRKSSNGEEEQDDEPYNPDVTVSKIVKRRRGKDLSLFVTMPLDILFEILSQLSPKDLVNVSQTNKLFHKTLSAPSAKTVWMAAREGASNAPEPPTGFTETRWANLLFKSTCQSCGAKGIPRVDWMLRMRVCTSCKKRHLVVASRFASQFPDYDKEILNYTTYTNVGGWAHGYSSNRKYYWDTDVEAVHKEWSTLKSNAHNGLSGAKDAFKVWKEERVKFVEEVVKLSAVYAKWVASDDGANRSEAASNRALRLAAVKKRFEDAGYRREDLDAALKLHTPGISSGVPNVTTAVWSKLRPKLEPLVTAQAEARLDKELKLVVTPRLQIFQGLYASYLSRLPPSVQRLQPPCQLFRPLPQVASLIEAAKDIVVTAKDFQPFIDEIQAHIEKFWGDYRTAIIAALPTSDYGEGLDPMNLARFWFSCEARIEHLPETTWVYQYRTKRQCGRKRLLGWACIQSHISCNCGGKRSFEGGIVPHAVLQQNCPIAFDEATSKAAESLLTLAGMDLKSTTITDMDACEERFVCNDCSSGRMYRVFDWRQAVAHKSTYHQTALSVTFRLATEDEKSRTNLHTPSLVDRPIWGCCHCDVHLFHAQPLVKVEEHIITDHSIGTPRPTDYYLDETARMLIQPYIYDSGSLNAVANYQCLHCPSAAPRRFIQGGVISHLLAKHNIMQPKSGVHYRVDPTMSVF